MKVREPKSQGQGIPKAEWPADTWGTHSQVVPPISGRHCVHRTGSLPQGGTWGTGVSGSDAQQSICSPPPQRQMEDLCLEPRISSMRQFHKENTSLPHTDKQRELAEAELVTFKMHVLFLKKIWSLITYEAKFLEISVFVCQVQEYLLFLISRICEIRYLTWQKGIADGIVTDPDVGRLS